MSGWFSRLDCMRIQAQTESVARPFVLSCALSCILTLSVPGTAVAQVVNGCGSGWNRSLVPDRFPLAGCEFRASCDQHDICYGRCAGKEKDAREPHCEYLRCRDGGDLVGNAECHNKKFDFLRQQASRRKLACDAAFYNDIATANGDRPVCRAFAAIYSRAVKWFGDEAWEGMDGRPLTSLTAEQAERSQAAIAEALRALQPEELNALTNEIIQRRSPIDWSRELIFDPTGRRLVNR